MPFLVNSRDLTRDTVASLFWWFFVVRVVGSLLVAIGIAALEFVGVLNFDPRPIIFYVIPTLIASSALWWLVFRHTSHPERFLVLQILTDLAIMSIGIYYSGGVHSQFVFLYLVPMISAALISLSTVILVGIASLAGYDVILIAEQSAVAHSIIAGSGSFGPDDAIRAGVLFIIMVLIGFQSYYYFRESQRKDAAVARIKDEFLFRTVHDLRSPSNAIRWITDKFSKPEYRNRFPELVKDIGMIQDLNDRMLALLKDLGELARGEKSAIELKHTSVDVRSVIHGIANELAPAMIENGIHFSYDPLGVFPPVVGDVQALKEVFMNLIDNAVKYNKHGGAIQIRHDLVFGKVITIIQDSGRGISQNDLAKLFTLYFRADVDSAIPGTGLGLYLVKKLVELMGGSITVASELGHGTTFTVVLPKAARG